MIATHTNTNDTNSDTTTIINAKPVLIYHSSYDPAHTA